MFYEVKVKFTSDETGKKVTNTMLVLCEFFSEAEKIALEEYAAYPDIDVVSIKRSNIREVINKDSDGCGQSYNLTLKSIFVDEKSGKEKATKYHTLLFAEDMNKAKKIADDYIKQGLQDLVFVGIKESPIILVHE